MAGLETPSIPVDDTPLWHLVDKIEKRAGGGNVTWTCKYCTKTFTGSYYRVKCHLLKTKGGGIAVCSNLTSDESKYIQSLVNEAELRKKQSNPKQVPLPLNSTLNLETVMQSHPKKRKGGEGPMDRVYNVSVRNELHGEIAKMFYTAGLSFNLARNPHYIRAFTLAASRTLPGYLPPGYNFLRTTLLQRERANIEKLLEPTKEAWQQKGVSICSDGWSDPQRRPLINIMAVCESGPMFLKAINCEGEYKDKIFIGKLLIDAVREVGCENVVQVVTDNAPVCKAAGLINICAPTDSARNKAAFEQCEWIAKVAHDAMVIKNFVMNHSMRLSIFNEHSKLKMLSIADTRFASTIIMLKRFKEIKKSLKNMVISDKWELYKEDDVEKAKAVRKKIMDVDENDPFWDKVDFILSFTAPIYVRKCDTDKPSLHLVYEWWDEMIENVRIAINKYNGYPKLYEVVFTILVERWNKSSTPLHCLAHSLNPRYYSNQWLNVSPNRIPPHRDIEISRERKKCITRYYPDDNVRRSVNEEFASFSAALEDFSDNDSMRARGLVSPTKWWCLHGSSTPTLQKLALKLLGHPCSSSCCERNWSTYNFILSLRRNKITQQRAEDLVFFVHNNLRLLSRSTPQYNEGMIKMWDVGADGFDSMDTEGVAFLQIADLSLDEPEFEGVNLTLIFILTLRSVFLIQWLSLFSGIVTTCHYLRRG